MVINSSEIYIVNNLNLNRAQLSLIRFDRKLSIIYQIATLHPTLLTTTQKGQGMISSKYSFKQFVESVISEDCNDIICLAEKEALETWRNDHHKKRSESSDEGGTLYQAKLIGLINFIRYGIKSRSLNEDDFQLCKTIQLRADQRKTLKLCGRA